MPLLCIQIVNYNTKGYLRACLLSVIGALEGSGVTHEINVLDNASDDDLTDLTSEFADHVSFHRSTTNLGFGGGHNMLAAKASSSILCFMNPDVVVTCADAFPRLLANLDDGVVGACGPRLVTEADLVQPWDHGELRGIRARIANGAGYAHWEPRDRPTAVAWVSGAFLLIRREIFDDVGGFDGRYFLYKEDEDLCLQVRRAGWLVMYDPRVSAQHRGSVVAGRDPRHFAASMEHYTRKNFPRRIRRKVLETVYLNVTRRL